MLGAPKISLPTSGQPGQIGHRSRADRFPGRLRQLRSHRNLTQEELAELVEVAPLTVRRWEAGQHPQQAHLRRLCDALEATPAELGLEPAGPLDSLELEEGDRPAAEEIEEATLRLRRSYSTSAPAELLVRLDDRLRQLRRLLSAEQRAPRRRALLEAAGWLTLLRGTVLNDLDHHEPAQSSIYVARQLARELGHGELEAWTYETAAWIAATDDRHADGAELAGAGIAVAPAGSHGLVAATMQRARINGQLGEATAAVHDLLAGERALAKVGAVSWPDDHYSIDPSKARFYASGAFAALRKPAETIEHAADVIRANSDPRTRNYWPTRIGSARLEWAMALVDQGEEDGATALASQVLAVPWHFRAGHASRTRTLLGRMRDRRLRSRLAGELEARLGH